jgi:hypothetical protein
MLSQMMIILATRPTVDDSEQKEHLTATFERIRTQHFPPSNGSNSATKSNVLILELLPLTLENVNEMVFDSLHSSSLLKSLTLAEFLADKSEGNPLFIQQILHLLSRENLLTFHLYKDEANDRTETPDEQQSTGAVEWRYNLNEIRRFYAGHATKYRTKDSNAASNVGILSFIASHLSTLAPASLELLQLGSCLGKDFSLSLLSLLSSKPPQAVAEALEQPIREEILSLQSPNTQLIPSTEEDLDHHSPIIASRAQLFQSNPAITSPQGENVEVFPEDSLKLSFPHPGPSNERNVSRLSNNSSIHSSQSRDSDHKEHQLEVQANNPLDLSSTVAAKPKTKEETADLHYWFNHDKLHEAVALSLTEERRAEVHLKIANMLLQQESTRADGSSGLKSMPSVAIYNVANHYISALPLLSNESFDVKYKVATFLHKAAILAKSDGTYRTALLYCKEVMFLLGIEAKPNASENSESSDLKSDQLSEMIESSENHSNSPAVIPATSELQVDDSLSYADHNISSPFIAQTLLRPADHQDNAGRQYSNHLESDSYWNQLGSAAPTTASIGLIYSVIHLRAELEHHCASHNKAQYFYTICLRRARQSNQSAAQMVELQIEFIRLLTVKGQYGQAIQLGIQALKSLGLDLQQNIVSLKPNNNAPANNTSVIDSAAVSDKMGGINAAMPSMSSESLYIRQKALLQLKNREINLQLYHQLLQLMHTDFEDNIMNLATRLKPSSSEADKLINLILSELILPSYLYDSSILQFICLTSVLRFLKLGISGQEGFVFCMLGAVLISNSFDGLEKNNESVSSLEYAENAKQWGKLGLILSLKFNNKNAYCRSLMINSMFISAFVGHMESALHGLQEAICKCMK